MSIDVTPPRETSLSQRVAEEIRVLLARRRMRQSQLARELQVSEQWLSVRLRGVQAIDLDDLERIAAALGVTVRDLIPDSGPESITVRYPTPDGPARPSSRVKPATRSDAGRRSDNRRPRDVRPFGHPGMIPPPEIGPERWAA